MENLFELTEENIEKHLSMVVKKRRKDSMIRLWRNRVNESRQRKSLLPVDEKEFEAFLSENISEVESSSVSQKSIVTVVPLKPTETEDSFITANDENELATLRNDTHTDLIKTSEIIFQTQELYEHFDPENNILFYENKLLANPVNKGKNRHQEVINLNISSENETVTELPIDYDTDDLRKELKAYGEKPGPITKNTKRLYLRRLVRYHRSRNPQGTNSNVISKCSK